MLSGGRGKQTHLNFFGYLEDGAKAEGSIKIHEENDPSFGFPRGLLL